MDSKPIFCGGRDDSGGNPRRECFQYTIQGFKSFATLTYEAENSASTVVQIDKQECLWISGGNMKNISQVVYSSGTVSEGPEMSEDISDHCVVISRDRVQ